jgi:hypothetical protein
MIEIIQSETFRKWISGMRDHRARALIAARLRRLANGLPGDTEAVGDDCVSILGRDIDFTIFNMARRSSSCYVEATKARRSEMWNQRNVLRENGENPMVEKFSVYDPAAALTNDETIRVFLSDALETGNVKHLTAALDIVARAKGISRPMTVDGPTAHQHLPGANTEAIPDSRLAEILTSGLPIPWSEILPFFEMRATGQNSRARP